MSADDACTAVARIVPEATPNRRVLMLGGAILGLDRDLERAAERTFYRDRHRFGARGNPTGLRPPAL